MRIQKLAILITLLSIPLLKYGTTDSLFKKFFVGQTIGKTLADQHLSEGKVFILYDYFFGLNDWEYKNLIDWERAGQKVQIVYVAKKEGVQTKGLGNYNRTVWNYMESKISHNDHSTEFGCVEKSREWSMGLSWVDKGFPLLEFTRDSLLTLTDEAQCLIDEYYIPILNLQNNGRWQLIIYFEVLPSYIREVKIPKAKYVSDFFIVRGVKPDQVKIMPSPFPGCQTDYFPDEYFTGIKVKWNEG